MASTSTITIHWIFFVLAGISIPSIVIGRSVIGVELALALICIPFLSDRAEIWVHAKDAMRTLGGLMILITFVAWIPSLTVSTDFMVSFETMTRSLLYIVAAVFVWSTLIANPHLLDNCLRTLIISSVILTGLAVLEILGLSDLISLLRGHGWDGYPDDRMLKETAISGAFLVPILIWAAVRLRGPWAVFGIFTLVEMLWLMKLTVNRSAMAGILAFLIAVGLLSVIHKRSFKIGILAISVVTICCAAVIGWLYLYFTP